MTALMLLTLALSVLVTSVGVGCFFFSSHPKVSQLGLVLAGVGMWAILATFRSMHGGGH
jgi:Na+/phosphate symporter